MREAGNEAGGKGIFSGAFGLDCDNKNNCYAMRVFANIGKDPSANAAWMTSWNNKMPFVRVYNDKDGNLIFAWDTLLTGVSPDDVVVTAKIFKQLVDLSSDFKP